ncbi:MAG: hypothetical protein K9H48_07990, partial [Melioribacteraceae bacterium]|nr:hypothetical protein [Melioribacteraceae bacterium]
GDYYSKRDHDLPRIIGILTYRGTSVDKATHTIVGHHENLESGVLYWFPNLQQAKVVKREMKKDPRSSNIKIKTKDEALNLK